MKPEDFTVRPDEAYHAADSSSSGNLFRVLATKFASVSHEQSKSTGLKVSAVKGGNLYTLNNPDSLFEEIAFGEEHGAEMRTWFERCREKGWKPRFVVGLRTFVDATVARDTHASTDTSAGVQIPVSSLHGDVLGLADVELKGRHKGSKGTEISSKLPGERIYSICYMKIRISTHYSDVTPSLEGKNVWRAFYETRDVDGPFREEYAVQVDLEDDNDTIRWETQEVETTEVGTVRFAVPFMDAEGSGSGLESSDGELTDRDDEA